eukprot:TRINITY_DN21480_c0_g1_i1.p2 TRINITY_DN21480_c0_g1~~TRINITY_DN21480_c0_g1_i1.p2  ORF type:complete len:118 (-),score=54.72 TRINITY_DN21480_c0_g1_i1:69-422(-)
MTRRPQRSTQSRSSAASDVYKRQIPMNRTAGFNSNAPLPPLGGQPAPAGLPPLDQRKVLINLPALEQRSVLPCMVLNTSQKDEARKVFDSFDTNKNCLLYTSPSPRDRTRSRMPSSA